MGDDTNRRAAFTRHGGFAVGPSGIRVETSPFRATVEIESGSATVSYTVSIEMPTLAAVVEGESVGDVVHEGWAETLARRIREAHHAASEIENASYDISWDREEVTAHITIRRPSAAHPPTDAIVSLVQYVEGTYLQGVIPGYDYGPPVDEMLSAARQRGAEPTDDSGLDPDIDLPG